MKIKNYLILGLPPLALALVGCQPPNSTTVTTNVATDSANDSTTAAGKPLIEAAPVAAGEGDYKFITGDDFKLTVRAADAKEVELYYQPVTAEDRALKLKTLTAPAEGTKDSFVADLKIPEDFNGEVWARVKYASGETKETEHLLLAKRSDAENIAGKETAQTDANAAANSNNSNSNNSNSNANNQTADTDESARSDKMTNGRIERAALKAGDGNVRITVNVPAFTMTLWQNDKEIKSYYVGVGRKNYPIPVGMRSADKIILNPNWIPPDSEWVRNSPNVEPYQKITADDPLNPLGKIKIPLGQAYLLHEAAAPTDIGNLVSHGCVRVLRDDLFEITEMISRARNLSITKDEIAAARKNTDRRVIDLKGDVPVDINYDSIVVENGILSIYPDVYERKTNTPENLRAELESYGIDAAKLDDAMLNEMLKKIDGDHKFTVALADIKAGNSVKNGKIEPLTPQQAKKSEKKS
ncbi:MAG: L,D-transpeptidase [Pyrinomonadaceae bacterium]|nr:L,D-transpeptidase [Pyrinomonadaceae bacterium]